MEIKVSVIVPVYNGAIFLAGCLGNLVNQTLEQIEIIIVNDCSTDTSLNIINDCKTQFSDKIQVINFDKNQGPGAARNAGIAIARGKYIGFVDCDDMIDVTMYEKLYIEAVNNNCDVVDCGFYNEKEQNSILYTSDELKGVLDNKKRAELIAAGGYIWSKIYKREYMRAYGIQFRNEYVLEDSDFITYVFSTMKTIGNVKEVLYKYTYTKDSLSSTKKLDRYVDSILSAIKSIYEKESKLSNYPQIRDAVEYEIVHMYSCAIIMLLHSIKGKNVKDTKELQKVIEKLSELAAIKRELVSGDYDSNFYVKDKISKDDIQIMKMNDQNPEALVLFILPL